MNRYTWSGKTILRNMAFTLIFLIFIEFLARMGVFLVVATNLFLLLLYVLDLFFWGGVVKKIDIDLPGNTLAVEGVKWFRTFRKSAPLTEAKLTFGLGPGPLGLKLTALRMRMPGYQASITPDYHGWLAEDLQEIERLTHDRDQAVAQ